MLREDGDKNSSRIITSADLGWAYQYPRQDSNLQPLVSKTITLSIELRGLELDHITLPAD